MDKVYAVRVIAEIQGLLDIVLTSRDVGFRKPNKAGYIQLAEILSTVAGNCIFVGDEDKDIIGANNAGMISVLIDRDSHNADYGQEYTIGSLEEIAHII